jgi:hypothetical protein
MAIACVPSISDRARMCSYRALLMRETRHDRALSRLEEEPPSIRPAARVRNHCSFGAFVPRPAMHLRGCWCGGRRSAQRPSDSPDRRPRTAAQERI